MDPAAELLDPEGPASEELLAFEGQAEAGRRAMRRALATFAGLMAVGVIATIVITAQRLEEVRAEYLRDDVGLRVAAFGLLTAALVSFAASRSVRGLTMAACWPSEALKRFGRLVAVAVPLLGMATHGLALLSFHVGYERLNEAASRYDEVEWGAMEPMVAAGLGFGVLLLGLRTSPSAAAEGRAADALPDKQRELGLLIFATAVLFVTAFGLMLALDWHPLGALLSGSGAAIVLTVGGRPLVLAQGQGDADRARRFNGVLPVLALVAAVIATGCATLSFVWAYEIANTRLASWRQLELGMLELAVAALLGGVALAVVLATGLLRYVPDMSEDGSLDRQISRLWRARIVALAAVTAGALVSLTLAKLVAMSAWLSLGAGVVVAVAGLMGGSYAIPLGDAEDVEVEAALAEMQRAKLRNSAALLAGGAAALFTGVVGLMLTNHVLEWINRGRPYYERVNAGLWTFFGWIAAATLVALWVRGRLQHKVADDADGEAEDDEVGGIFDDSLAKAGRMVVRQRLDIAELLTGIGGRARYELVDGGGAYCAEAVDRGGFFARLLLGGRRRLDIAVDDLGKDALRIVRPFVWWHNRAVVSEDGREVGSIRKRWSLFGRRFTVCNERAEDRYELRSHWLWRSRFAIHSAGRAVGELRRQRRPWYLRLLSRLPEPDRFAIELPQGSELDDRRLLLGALFLVDMTHYPSQSGPRFAVLGTLALALVLQLLSPAGDATGPPYGDSPQPYEDSMEAEVDWAD